jgi:hypothetical protein
MDGVEFGLKKEREQIMDSRSSIRSYLPDYQRIYDISRDAAKQSGLPGEHNGPADAFRHIVASGEAARRYGEFIASGLGSLNEIVGDLNKQPAAERRMDDANNAIGIRIGIDARDFDEVLERARAAIDDAMRHDGTGTDGTAQWLPKSEWSTETPKPDSGKSEHEPDTRSPTAQRALARPVDSWTQDDVRAVQNSKMYLRGDGPDRTATFAKVRHWYERQTMNEAAAKQGTGPIRVHAYVRGDGTRVASHTRSAPI